MAKPRWECVREIDQEICRLKEKKRRVQRAEARHLAVRGYADQREAIESFNCACVRAEYGREGAQRTAFCHYGDFRKFVSWISGIYANGGHVTSIHFVPDDNALRDTDCGYWARRRQQGR